MQPDTPWLARGFELAGLPPEQDATGIPDTEPKQVSPGSRARVLVVEDEDVVRDLVVEMLSGNGFEVEWAENGTVALEKLRSAQNFDVLFTDIVMPDGPNGVELARQARRMLPGLRVLLASGYSRQLLTGREGLTDNMRFLPKPYRLSQMLSVLSHLVAAR